MTFSLPTGDIFDLKVYRPWDFNSTKPIRSIIPVHLLSGIPLLALKLLAHLTQITIGSASILRATRMWMMLLTFTVDWNVYKLLKAIVKKDKEYSLLTFLIVLTSSFVILVFGCKTFSNTLEMILFAWLVRLTIGEETKFRQNIPTLSLILVTGIFTRPTFLIFAFIPLCYCFFKSSKCQIKTFFRNTLEYFFFCLSFMLMYIIIDSIYFQHLDLSFIGAFQYLNSQGLFEIVQNNLTITPLNFVMYNLKGDNLAQHGIHNRLTHVLVNAPCLFLGLVFLAYFDVVRGILRFKFQMAKHLSTEKALVLLSSSMFSILILSIFPHQEARFLVPLIVPLVVLYAPRLVKYKVLIVIFWVIPNVGLTHFWGTVHQAGIVPAILATRNKLISPHLENGDNVTAVFWKSYMPPRFLFGIPLHGNITDKNLAGDVLSVEASLFSVLDLAGASEKELHSNLRKIFGSKNGNLCSSRKKYVYLFVPGSVVRGSECSTKSFDFNPVLVMWPHFSGEHPPIFNQYSFGCKRGQSGSRKCLLSDARLCHYVPKMFHNFLDSVSYKVFSVVPKC